MTAMAPPEPGDPRLHDLSAARLVQRYRGLLWLVALPVFVLLAMLTAWQARSGWNAAVADLERTIVRPHAELQALVRNVEDHLSDLRQQAQSDLLAAPREPDVALKESVLPWQAGGPADGISLNAPEVAENGANVPIEIKVALPGLQRILLIGERNAYPLLLDLAWSAPGPAALDLRIKLGESAPLRVIAVAGGKVHSAVRMVRVTVGGCAVS